MLEQNVDNELNSIRFSTLPEDLAPEIEKKLGNKLIEEAKFRNLRKVLDTIRYRRDEPGEKEIIDSVVDRLTIKAIKNLLELRKKEIKAVNYFIERSETTKEIKEHKKHGKVLEKNGKKELAKLFYYLSDSAKFGLFLD